MTAGSAVISRPAVAPACPTPRHASAASLIPAPAARTAAGDLRLVGEDASEMLDLIAAQLKVLQIARLKKSCRRCAKMAQHAASSRPIPGSMASAALLAYILVSKYDDHLPRLREAACRAHLRRDLRDERTKTRSAIAREAPDRIGALYDIEREITAHPADIRFTARQKHSAPKVGAVFAWAERQLALSPGKGDLAKAFRYGLNRRAAFRPIGIGRRIGYSPGQIPALKRLRGQ